MKILDPGHLYKLNYLDDTNTQELRFVKREGDGYPGNIGHYPGTNIQEVLRVLIDRTKYLDNQIPNYENQGVIQCLRRALWCLEVRAARRHKRKFKGSKEIELQPFCSKCGHIGCGH